MWTNTVYIGDPRSRVQSVFSPEERETFYCQRKELTRVNYLGSNGKIKSVSCAHVTTNGAVTKINARTIYFSIYQGKSVWRVIQILTVPPYIRSARVWKIDDEQAHRYEDNECSPDIALRAHEAIAQIIINAHQTIYHDQYFRMGDFASMQQVYPPSVVTEIILHDWVLPQLDVEKLVTGGYKSIKLPTLNWLVGRMKRLVHRMGAHSSIKKAMATDAVRIKKYNPDDPESSELLTCQYIPYTLDWLYDKKPNEPCAGHLGEDWSLHMAPIRGQTNE